MIGTGSSQLRLRDVGYDPPETPSPYPALSQSIHRPGFGVVPLSRSRALEKVRAHVPPSIRATPPDHTAVCPSGCEWTDTTRLAPDRPGGCRGLPGRTGTGNLALVGGLAPALGHCPARLRLPRRLACLDRAVRRLGTLAVFRGSSRSGHRGADSGEHL